MRHLVAAVFLLLTHFPLASFGQDRSLLISAFESAGREFNVPADVLKGIAFSETRWQHLEHTEGDTARCDAMHTRHIKLSIPRIGLPRS